MLKMEIRIDEKKIEKNSDYTTEQIFNMIDEVAKEREIVKKDNKGFFIGNNNNRDYSNFGKIVLYLKKQEWFLPFVKTWVLYIGDERDDLAKHYIEKY